MLRLGGLSLLLSACSRPYTTARLITCHCTWPPRNIYNVSCPDQILLGHPYVSSCICSHERFDFIVQAADSFALGVLLWEMYSGVRAWSSMNHAQVITAVAVNKRSLKFPAEAPAAYVQLARSLMSHVAVARPSFEEALESIKVMQNSMIWVEAHCG